MKHIGASRKVYFAAEFELGDVTAVNCEIGGNIDSKSQPSHCASIGRMLLRRKLSSMTHVGRKNEEEG